MPNEIVVPAIVKLSMYNKVSDTTCIALVAPVGFDYCELDIEWPLTVFQPGDVTDQNQPNTKYRIRIEREPQDAD